MVQAKDTVTDGLWCSALAALGVLAFACSSETSGGMLPDPDEPEPTSPPTFHRDIAPLLQARCVSCHSSGGIGPFTLSTYEDARVRAATLAAETAALRMPPWAARPTEECQPRFGLRGDQHLTDEQISVFTRWAEAGAPEGDPKDAPPPPQATQAGGLSRVDVALEPRSGWTVTGRNDQFRCFVLDPGWSQRQWVTGVQFVPGNPKVVHHAIAFLDPGRASEALAGEDGSYECFAGPGFTDTSILTAWAPGAIGGDLDPDIAFQLEGGGLIVLQVHYHALGNDGETDRSTIQLKLGETRPTWLTQVLLIGNFESPLEGGDGLMPGANDPTGQPAFVIPAGAERHVENLRFTLPEFLDRERTIAVPNLKVIGVGTHMHYVGVDMKFDIEHLAPRAGEPERECMIQTPAWDFQWQRGYAYDVPVQRAPEWRPGDKLHMRCTYNNSLSNPHVVAALAEQGLDAPHDVYLGEETLDEMCLAAMGIAYVNPF